MKRDLYEILTRAASLLDDAADLEGCQAPGLYREAAQECEQAARSLPPSVGMGGTLQVGSDSYPYTITRVGPTFIEAQRDDYKRTDSNGMSEDQRYTFERNTNMPTERFYKGDDGRYATRGRVSLFYVGMRRMYRDPSF